MKFSLYTKRKDKLIQIIKKEDGRAREIMAIVPYFGGRYSFEYAFKRERALFLKDILEKDLLAVRNSFHDKMRAFCVGAPFIDILDSKSGDGKL